MRKILGVLILLVLASSFAVQAQTPPAWQPGVAYAVGAKVSYSGANYQCLQAHTSLSNWTPDATPALWTRLSGSATTCSAAPGAPTWLPPSNVASTSVSLSWSPPSAPSGCTVTGYRVYRNGTLVGSPAGATFTATGLSPSTSYSFTVTALDSFGASAASAPLSVTTTAASCGAAPSVPAGLAASSTSATGTTLSWSASTAPAGCTVTGYRVYRNGTLLTTVTAPGAVITGLSPSTTYSFTVASVDSFGASAQSAPVTVTTTAVSGSGCAPVWSASAVYTGGMTASLNGVNYTANWWNTGQSPANNSGPAGSGQPWTITGTCAACSAAPQPPAGLAGSQISATGAYLTWTAPVPPSNCSITGYTVYRNGASVASAAGTSFMVTGLSPSTQYSFAVAASTSFGSSPASPAINVTTTASGTTGGTRTFSPYIDMGLTASQNLLTIQRQSGVRAFTLAFIVNGGSCVPTWGGVGSIYEDTLSGGGTMTSLIQSVRNEGAEIAISFGGAYGQELAQVCSTVPALRAAYEAVIDRYNPTWIDFDIEGAAVADATSIARRSQALAQIRAARPALKMSLTLPVLPTGLDANGYGVLTAAKAAGFDPDVVNVMAMDYGAAVDNGGAMGSNAISAASNTYAQAQAAGLTSKVGVTPMIGVNDVATEIFQLSDARMLTDFALANSYVGRLSMWSVSRDNGNCAGSPWASYDCSGLAQTAYQFSGIFSSFR